MTCKLLFLMTYMLLLPVKLFKRYLKPKWAKRIIIRWCKDKAKLEVEIYAQEEADLAVEAERQE